MSYDVAITDGPVRAIFDLKGPQAALADWAGDSLPGFPDAPNRRVREDGKTLAHIGPDHWLLIADLTREEALTDALKPADAPPEVRTASAFAASSSARRIAPASSGWRPRSITSWPHPRRIAVSIGRLAS